MAKFTKQRYIEELVKLPQFQDCSFEEALIQSFHRIDDLLEEEVIKIFIYIYDDDEIKKSGSSIDTKYYYLIH